MASMSPISFGQLESNEHFSLKFWLMWGTKLKRVIVHLTLKPKGIVITVLYQNVTLFIGLQTVK